MKKILAILLVAHFLIPVVSFAEKKTAYRFVMVPKDMNPWFDLVYEGAKQAAKMLEETTGSKFVIEYLPPKKADVAEQNQIIENIIATHPDGISIDLLDEKSNRVVLEEALKQGIKITIFDSVSPDGMALTSIGNDFCEQAKIASEKLVKLIGGKGEVAIMMGVPTAPNHMIRAQCHEAVFKRHPGIKLVAKGIDEDEIETAQSQATSIMKAHPNLKGWVSCDAAGPIGVGQAIKQADKVGKVLSVGMDDLPQMIELINEGVADSSASTKPRMQGYWTVLALWQATMGVNMPKRIDTGIAVISKDMAKGYKGF
jgi:ribose transport system substrate-binding protein